MDDTSNPSRIALRRRAAIADGGLEYTARRARLIETAALLFQERGYAATTLHDIAERFGTDRASLYYYVGSKDELLNECMARVLDANLAEGERIKGGPGTPRSKLAALICITLRSFEEHYPYAFVYMQENMSHVASQESGWALDLADKTRAYEQLVHGFLMDGISDGSIRSDLPAGLLANGLYGMMNWTHRWFTPGESWVADDLADAFLAVFFEGVAIQQGV